MDRLEELYQNFIDRVINDYPLTTNRSSEFDDAININQQIINRISNIRRYLTDGEFMDSSSYDESMDPIMYLTDAETMDQTRYSMDPTSEFMDSTRYISNVSNNTYINEYEYFDGVDEQVMTREIDLHEHSHIEGIDLTDANNRIIDALFDYVVNTTFLDFTYTELNELNDVKVTLTKEQFDKFEKKKVSESNKLTNCSICMDNYELDEIIVTLKCNHVYHENCIENWLCNQKVTCPICRKDTRETACS